MSLSTGLCFIKICFPAQSLPENINRSVALSRSENMLNLLNQWMRPVRDAVKAVHWTVMLLHFTGFSEHCPLDYDTINQVTDTAQVGRQKSYMLLLKVSASVALFTVEEKHLSSVFLPEFICFCRLIPVMYTNTIDKYESPEPLSEGLCMKLTLWVVAAS